LVKFSKYFYCFLVYIDIDVDIALNVHSLTIGLYILTLDKEL